MSVVGFLQQRNALNQRVKDVSRKGAKAQSGKDVRRIYIRKYLTHSLQLFTDKKKLPGYAVFAPDRARVRGAALAETQLALANGFVQRSAFLTKYPASLSTAAQFIDAVLATIQSAGGVDLSAQKPALTDVYNNAGGCGRRQRHVSTGE